MKKLSILFAIVAMFCFTVVSCDKESHQDTNTVTPAALTDAPDASEDEEIFDDLEDEKEPFELEERAKAKIYIDSMHTLSRNNMSNNRKFLPQITCQKGLADVNMLTSGIADDNLATTIWTIRFFGKGFGNSQGVISARTTKGIEEPLIIKSWNDSVITVERTRIIPSETGKFRIRFSITNTALSITKVKTYPFTCQLKTGTSPNTGFFFYPLSTFECGRQLVLMGKPIPAIYGSTPPPIDSNYIPQVGDILKRQAAASHDNNAIVVSIDNAGKKPKYKIYERNFACNNSLKKRNYYYDKKTGFSLKTNEPQFTHYLR